MDNLSEALIRGLYGAGLFQLGTFSMDRRESHIRLRLEMLPSYPDLLQMAASYIQQRLHPDINRLVCTSEAVALGTAVSLAVNLPLVWHTGNFGTPSRQFIGAYDIQHPAALIMLTSRQYTSDMLNRIQRESDSVGLQIRQSICLMDDSPINEQENSIGLIRLADAVRLIMEDGLVPSALGRKALTEL